MPEKPHITVLDAITLDRQGDIDFAPLAQIGSVTFHMTTAPAEIPERVAGSDILLVNKVVLGPAEFDAAPNLKLLCVCATGVNNIDLAAARERGITVCNVSGYSTPSVAQHTLTLLLNLATSIHRYASEATVWPGSRFFCRLDHPVIELAGKTLGIAGAGTIGTAVGKVAQALGMRIQVLGRDGHMETTAEGWQRKQHAEFFATSHAVTLHCPLTPDTRHLINEQTLALMPKGAFLINTGRGDLIDEGALKKSLLDHQLGGAALDVLTKEPPPADHPLLDPAIPNLLITPHSAWAATESRRRLLAGVAANIRAFLAGTPTNAVPRPEDLPT